MVVGDFADDMIERELQWHMNVIDARAPRRRRNEFEPTFEDLGGVVWTPREGEQILVRDMGQRHRRNALAMLIRRHGEARVMRSRIGAALEAWKDEPSGRCGVGEDA